MCLFYVLDLSVTIFNYNVSGHLITAVVLVTFTIVPPQKKPPDFIQNYLYPYCTKTLFYFIFA